VYRERVWLREFRRVGMAAVAEVRGQIGILEEVEHPLTSPPIQWVTGAIFSRIMRPGHEAIPLLTTSVEAKKIYTSAPSSAFMAQEHFTLYPK
jgi:hypothetical protein